jgi:ATP-dependent DNA helicase PIF1
MGLNVSMTQDVALAILKSGKNVFLTGEPGAGKTHTINRYIAWLREHGIDPAITASTGIAATHVGGMTIHSWSGIGIKKKLTGDDYARLLEKDALVARLNAASVLIIDEISMLDARALDAVDGVCRSLRQDGRPFGGLQVLLVGDFFQLPPVATPYEERPEFAYRSQAWQDAEFTVCYLTEQHRQQDGEFLALLGALRSGHVTEPIRHWLTGRRLVDVTDNDHTKLFSHNLDVDRVNQERLARIDEKEQVFEMVERGSAKFVEVIKKHCLSPDRLALKIGARVMFTKNHPDGRFVNGTIGEVIAFEEEAQEEDEGSGVPVSLQPVIRTLDGVTIRPTPMDWAIVEGDRVLAKVTQFPLRLAWAITVHKSQGMTLDAAVMDLSQAFEYGQGYVALSRVRSSDGLHLLGWNERALQVHPQILGVDASFRSESEQAAEAMHDLSADLRTELEERFIRMCGGTLEVMVRKPKKEKRPISAKGATYLETLNLFKAGKSVEEIASARGIVTSTVWNHLEKLSSGGRLERQELLRVIPAHITDVLPSLHEVLKKGEGRLSPAFEAFQGRYSYDDLRLARMVMDVPVE